jgi:TetR/AcrR family transcriptional regulator, cholesterol catabolism regulator
MGTPMVVSRPTAERLFDVAAELFCEHGYAVTTTREIAAAVGIRQASLYYHVANKEDLLYQICVSSLQELLAEVGAALSTVNDPIERIEVLAGTHLRTILRHQIRHLTMLTELRALSGAHYKTVVAMRRQYADLVRTVLQEAQKAGAVRTDISSRYLYLALLNILNRAVRWFRPGQSLSEDELAQMFTSVYLRGAAAQHVRIRAASTRVEHRKPAPQSTFERLLEAAATLFAQKGYAAASTREIAEVLGIRKASLYYHVENKEDLLYNICKSSLAQIHTDVAGALAGVTDPHERMDALIRTHLQSMLRERVQFVAVGEMHFLSGERLSEVISLRDAYEDVVRGVLSDARRASVLRQDISVKYLCLILLGLLNRVELWYRPDGGLSPDELGLVFEGIFLNGIVA